MSNHNNHPIFVDNLRSFAKDYPQINKDDWFICTHNSITSFIPVEDRFIVVPALRHNKKYNKANNLCQAKYINDHKEVVCCENDADLFGITILCNVVNGEKLGSRFKFYCAECIAQRAMINLPILTDPETFAFEDVDDYGESTANNEIFIIQERIAFFETYLGAAISILEEKYPEKLENINDSLNVK